jgi:CDP-diacylglycerol--glycerol-3-phosphate 3-phosphatidyltransferase
VRSHELTLPLRRVQQGYTDGVRSLALRSMRRLAQTRVTPNALTVAGVSLSVVGGALVGFESHDKYLFYWLGGALFLVGSILDILDGALARAGGKSTPFGAFLDSTTDRLGEGALLLAIALVFAHAHQYVALAFAVAAVGGSFLVPYARAKSELIGIRGDVGFGGRAERVFVLVAALVFAPWGSLPWAIGFLAALAWVTVVQRILHVRKQLLGGTNGIDER